MVRGSLCALALAVSVPPAAAQTLLGAADVLDALPPSVPLAEARAVAIVPAGRGAATPGVLFVKQDGRWAEPLPVALTGVRHPADTVFVFRTRRALARVLNGDGRIDPDVGGYERRGGGFGAVVHGGASLTRRTNEVADRKTAAELRAKLTELTAPKPDWVASVIDESWVIEHRKTILCSLAAVWAWFAASRRMR